MDNEVNKFNKKLKLDLKINAEKCEYCDWNPMCCEWCKLKSNKRKLIRSTDIHIEKKRSSSV